MGGTTASAGAELLGYCAAVLANRLAQRRPAGAAPGHSPERLPALQLLLDLLTACVKGVCAGCFCKSRIQSVDLFLTFRGTLPANGPTFDHAAPEHRPAQFGKCDCCKAGMLSKSVESLGCPPTSPRETSQVDLNPSPRARQHRGSFPPARSFFTASSVGRCARCSRSLQC